jgi:superkiller protein 3
MHYQRARVLFDLQRYHAVIAELAEHLAQFPQDAAAMALLAHTLALVGKLDEAATTVQTAIDLDPTMPNVFHAACAVCGMRGELYTAEQAAREYLRLDSGNPVAHYFLTWVLCCRRRWREALRASDDLLALAPHDSEYWEQRGKILLQLKRPGDAEQAFRQALALDAENADAHEDRGRTLLQSRQHA